MPHQPCGVLFDLDGTLADTAPDLASALNRICSEDGLPTIPFAQLRPHTSSGVRGMLGGGLGITPDDARYPKLFERFLAHYEQALCVDTALFPGIPELLNELDARHIPWGIVTNKRQRYTLPLVAQLGLTPRARSIVSGDSTAHPKPAPDSLLLAARELGLAPAQCLYIGDDLRDIQAGHAASMTTVAVRYGYLGTSLPPEQWGAHHLIDHPREILSLPALAC